MSLNRLSLPCKVLAILLTLWFEAVIATPLTYHSQTITSSLTITSPYNIITITDVTFSGNINIQIMVGAIAASSTYPIYIDMCNVQITNGATLYIFGTTGSVAGMQPLYLSMNGVNVIDGGLAWGNFFPLYSRMIWARSTVAISRRTTSFSLVSADGPNSYTGWAYAVVWANFQITSTAFLMTNNNIGGAFRNGLFPLYFAGFLVQSHGSFTFQSCHVDNSFAIHTHNSFVVSDHSVFWIRNNNMVCDRFCMSFGPETNSIVVQTQSAFILEGSSASANGHDLMFIYGNLLVTDSSWWFARGNHFVTPRYAFSVSGSAYIQSNSVLSFVDNSMLGTPWKMPVATSGGGVANAQCNDLGGASLTSISQYQTAGINGLTNAYRCPRRGQCNDVGSTCFPLFTDTSKTCTCSCTGSGVGQYCTPVIPPFLPPMCQLTQTLPLSETGTYTKTIRETPTITDYNVSETKQLTLTTPITVTHQPTPSPTITESKTINRYSKTATITISRSPPLSGTKSRSETRTMTLPVSGTGSITSSENFTVTVSESEEITKSPSNSTAFTVTQTNSPSSSKDLSHSVPLNETLTVELTNSVSDCPWNNNITHTPSDPLVNSAFDNYTMLISYTNAFAGYNFSIHRQGQWYIDYIDYLGETLGVNFTSIAGEYDGNVIAVEAPIDRYSSVAQRTVTIEIVFKCSAVHHSVIYQIVITPEPAVVPTNVLDTIAQASILAGLLAASPPVAAAAAWSLIIQQLLLCESIYQVSMISFTRLTVGSDDYKYLRGSIFGNGLIMLGEAVIVVIIALIVVVKSKSKQPRARFRRAMTIMQWPSVMHITVGALLQQTMICSVALFSLSSNVEDYALAFIASSGCLFYTVHICLRLRNVYQQTRGSQRRWERAEGMSEDKFIFGNYGKPWYAGFETIMFFLTGIILGIPSNGVVCIVQKWLLFAISLICIAVIAYTRPMKTILGDLFIGLIQVLTFACANAMLVVFYVPDQQLRASNVALICVMLIPLVALLKVLTDIVASFRNGMSLWHRLFEEDKLNTERMPWEEDEGEKEQELLPIQDNTAPADDLDDFLVELKKAEETKKKPAPVPDEDLDVPPPPPKRQADTSDVDDILAGLM